MNTKLDFYPFLISRNETKDYRVIVAPKFLLDNQLPLSALKEATDNEKETEFGIVKYCSVLCKEDRNKGFTLLFRVDTATEEDIGKSYKDILKDNVGRPIQLIQGVVCSKIISIEEVRNQGKITSKYFHNLREYLRPFYGRFWYDDTQQNFITEPLFNQDISSDFLKIISIADYIFSSQKTQFTPIESRPRERVQISSEFLRLLLLAGIPLSILILLSFFLDL
ncbi:hypothetical protein MEO94_29115 [Dolichospermum sp. ST_sed9]|nr:hypothetical protein [Dolichospermum sp. ST_sed9]